MYGSVRPFKSINQIKNDKLKGNNSKKEDIMINIVLDFDKRFEGDVPAVATYSGIYVVYAYNGSVKDPKWVLLDIGQAKDMHERHSNHERRAKWEEYVTKNNMELVIYTAEITNEHNYRDIAEAALLYNFKPLISQDGKDGYHHEDVRIQVDGKLKAVFGEFVVYNTDK